MDHEHEHEHGHGDASDRGDTATPGVNDTIIGVSFDDRFRATEFLTAMGRLASRKELVLKDVVLVTKSDDGTTRVEESTDPTMGRAALSGALWASLLGLILGGPVGWVAGGVVGAGVGAVTAKTVDLGVPDEWVAWFREAVQPGTTTVVILTTDVMVDPFVDEARRFAGAHLVFANMAPGIVGRIRQAFGEPAEGES
jgi:uncharacterized membrane protein